jgi:hypothetical protein
MRNPFAKARPAATSPEAGAAGALGQTLLALALGPTAAEAALSSPFAAIKTTTGTIVVRADCIGIAVAADGSTRRHASGQSMAGPWQKAFLVHTLPHRCQLCLHPATPEIVLDLCFVLDSPDPRVAQQRFDLFLASEIDGDLSLAAMAAQMQTLLQAELAAGQLDCLPQMSLAEWMRFRSQLERWLYTRFGLTVEDCALTDVGEQVDYAQMLLARAQAQAGTHAAVPANAHAQADARAQTPAPAPVHANSQADAPAQVQALHASAHDHAPTSAQAFAPTPAYEAMSVSQDTALLRRLFLELPDFSSRWRALNPPAGSFTLQQSVLQRLSLLKTRVAAMPALALAAPGQPLPASRIAARSDALRQAIVAWEHAWAMLARLQGAQDAPDAASCWQAEQDAILRMLANLEAGLERRAQVAELLP